MKQTAIQWLEEKSKEFAIDLDLLNYFQQAKQIEMQQIKEAHYDGQLAMSDFGAYRIFSEQYYNKTYGE